jgi:glutamate/tyrosine decarboxylase-like PLP-dependent enzyme
MSLPTRQPDRAPNEHQESDMKIPERGISREEVHAKLAQAREADTDFRNGRVFGYAYDAGREAERVSKEAYAAFLSENALDPRVYPSLRRFEIEVVSMCREHLRGGPEVVGTFTSGGTESVLLAVKTARDYSLARKPDLREPEMVLPSTAHAAFHKAAHYFGVKVISVDVDPVTYEADVEATRRAIGPNTILLVGSAPQFAHGVVDPIRALGALALEHELLLHVDGCIGGFILPYVRRLGRDVPDFDFSVPGVTSISMDLHKYAFCAKGASVLLMRDKALRSHQLFACSDWPGYGVVNSTIQSTKSGGPVAAAWATLHHIGDAGYLELTRRTLDATDRLAAGIESVPGLRLMGKPVMGLLAFTSAEADVFHVADEMKLRKWLIGPQLAYGSSPANIHLTLGPTHDAVVDEFVADLAASVEAARTQPKSELPDQIRAVFANLRPEDLSPEVLQQMLAMAGASGTSLPEREAEVNQIMNALPIALRERLLVGYVNELFTEQAL